MTRSVSIFGATGSVGLSTLDLVRQHRDAYRVVALTANGNASALAKLAIEFGAELAVVADEAAYPALKDALQGTGIEAAAGAQALVEAPQRDVDWTMASIVGCAGLPPTMAAIQAGKTVALANKEALVSAGALMMAAVRQSGASLLPVDSEHNAIFQCLAGSKLEHVRKITLTASGGPFRGRSAESLRDVSVADALKHPTWSMGPKITIDSVQRFLGMKLEHCFILPVNQKGQQGHEGSNISAFVLYCVYFSIWKNGFCLRRHTLKFILGGGDEQIKGLFHDHQCLRNVWPSFFVIDVGHDGHFGLGC